MEIWTALEFDGYEVSDQGEVRSVDRVITGCDEREQHWYGRILKPYSAGRYLAVKIEGHNRYVHHLVASAFLGETPPRLQVLHRNDIPHDNRSTNLYFGTRSQNLQDCVRNGRHAGANKTHCKYGHEFTEENTYYHSRGRTCRACRRRIDAGRSVQRRERCRNRKTS